MLDREWILDEIQARSEDGAFDRKAAGQKLAYGEGLFAGDPEGLRDWLEDAFPELREDGMRIFFPEKAESEKTAAPVPEKTKAPFDPWKCKAQLAALCRESKKLSVCAGPGACAHCPVTRTLGLLEKAKAKEGTK